MNGFVNPLAPRVNGLQAKSAEIKAWARQLTGLPEEASVTVVELACRDDGCPDIETVIGLLEAGKPIRTIRVHAAMTDVTYDAIVEALANEARR